MKNMWSPVYTQRHHRLGVGYQGRITMYEVKQTATGTEVYNMEVQGE